MATTRGQHGRLLERRTARFGLTEVDQLLATQTQVRRAKYVFTGRGQQIDVLDDLGPASASQVSRRSVSFALRSRISAMVSYIIEWCSDI